MSEIKPITNEDIYVVLMAILEKLVAAEKERRDPYVKNYGSKESDTIKAVEKMRNHLYPTSNTD